LCARGKDKRTDNRQKSALFVTRLKYFCSAFRLTQIFEQASLNVEALRLTLRSDRPSQFSALKRFTHNLLGKIRSKNSPVLDCDLADTGLVQALSISLKERFASGQFQSHSKGCMDVSVLVVEWLWNLQEPSAYWLVKSSLRRSASRRALDLDKHSDNKRKSSCYHQLDNVKDNGLIMAKPFIAARVPQKIEDKLNERVQETGLGKTEIIVNALAEYLGCSIDVPEETRAVDRLVTVEKELTELQNRVRALEKLTEKTTPPEIEGQRVLLFEPLSVDNTVDNQTESAEITTESIKEVSNKKPDNDLLTNRQISELTERHIKAVGSRHRRAQPIEWQNRRYIPVMNSNPNKWKLDNTP
jgi:hypothetical protein